MNHRTQRNGGIDANATASAGDVGSPPAAAMAQKRPLGAVIASAVNGTAALVRKHLELARIEATEAVSARAKGTGMMAVAGVFALYALGFLAASGSSALDLVLPTWAAQLIVGALFVVIAGVLVLVGRRGMRTAPKPARTQETLKEDARWARQQIAR